MRQKKLKRIEVDTIPNGWSLNFDGSKKPQGFMYFTPKDLLYGFMVHIGMQVTDELEMDKVKDFVDTAIRWNDNKKCVAEIERLNLALKIMTSKRNSLAKRLIAERNRLISLKEDVDSLISEYAITDKAISDRIHKVTYAHNQKKLSKIQMKDLGIKNEELIIDEEDEDYDGAE